MKDNKGITLIALIITIAVLSIVISVAVLSVKGQGGVDKETKNNKKLFELQEVQQAVLETYIKYKQSDNAEYLIGIQCNSISDINRYAGEEANLLKDSIYTNYYVINNEENFKKIGIDKSTDFYIVNYKTGEVLNYTTPRNYDGKVLYTSAEE